MSFRSFFLDLFDRWGGEAAADLDPGVNPATGLPMTGGGFDVAGNPFGVDLHHGDLGLSASTGCGDHRHGCGYDPVRGW